MSQPILLLAGKSYSTPIVYNSLREQFEVAAVILEDRVPRAEFLRRRAKKLGFATVAGQTLFRTLLVPYLRASAKQRIEQILAVHNLSTSPIPLDKINRVSSANSDECIATLKRIQPAAVVVNGTRILSNEVLQSISAPFLNIHAGVTPLYRGVHGAYWALVNSDLQNCGVTVHLVDPGIDTGGIVAQTRIEPTERDNFASYGYLQLAAGLPLLCQAIRDALQSRLQVRPAPSGDSRLWTHPTIAEYVRNRRAGVR